MNVVDMHCDTISEIYDRRKIGKNPTLFQNDLHVDLNKLKKSNYLLQNFALFVNLESEKKPFFKVMELLKLYYEELELNASEIMPVFKYEDIIKNRDNGKISAMLSVEEGGVCEGKIKNLQKLYNNGVRMMTLTWNYKNELASPNKMIHESVENKSFLSALVADEENGLTSRGFEFITEMEKLGIIIDVSHLSDAGIWDVIQGTKKPFVASHSNARAIASSARNLTDKMIHAFSNRGCVIGINYYSEFLSDEKPKGKSEMEDIVKHMKHMRAVGGIECIGLGSDFDGISDEIEFSDASGLMKLAGYMEKNGFTSTEIDKIFYKNVLNLYKELL